MFSVFSVAFGLTVLVLLFRKNKAAFLAGLSVLFSLAYRMVDTAYLDVLGPIYAIELEKFVGGNGAAPMFVLSCLSFILPLWLLVRPEVLTRGIAGPVPESGYLGALERGALVGCTLVLAILYLDMLRIGTIPLLVGMDRLEYYDIAGVFHSPAYELNFLFSAILGVFTVLPRLHGRRSISNFFVVLFLVLQGYWALTGNRASSFLVTATYYAIPFAALAAMNARALLPRQAEGIWSSLLSARVVVGLGVVAGLVVLISLIINSYYDVRGYADPVFQITQRVFVQPVQLWAASWDDVHFVADPGISPFVLDRVIFNPDDPNSNTSIRYLMEKNLGYFRTAELIAADQQYAGGYPEIFFELFGGWLALVGIVLYGFATAGVLRFTISSLVRGRVLCTIMGVYLFFGFALAYIGGMLNFLIAYTFAIKAALALAAYLFESRAVPLNSTRRATPATAAPAWPARPPPAGFAPARSF